MPFINKVTVKGTTYYLENLVAGSGAYTVRLPNISRDDVFVTRNTVGEFTVSKDELKAMNTTVASLNTTVSSLNTQVGSLKTKTGSLETSINTLNSNINTVSNKVSNKVDKVEGKTLSTNDFTNEYKEKLDGLTGEYDIIGSASQALSDAKSYTDAQLAAFESFDTEIVDELPDTASAKENTFYLVPKTSGNGYEKYWLIDGEWDEFAGSSTEIVVSLDEVSEPSVDVDYIVYDGSICLYYKWIDNDWRMVAGSVAKVVESLDGEVANEFTDYYVKNGDNAYFHYRWDKDNEVYRMVGSDSYSKNEIDGKIATLSETFATSEALGKIQETATGNAEEIVTVKNDIKTINKTISEMKGDNENLIVQYNEVGSVLHLYERDENGEITIVDGDQEIKVKEISSTIIVGGTGNTLVSTVKLGLSADGEDDITELYGNSVSLNYILSTRKATTKQDESGNDVTVYEEAVIPGDITISLFKDNVYQTHFVVKKTSTTAQKFSFDVTNYVSLGSQVFTLKAAYVEDLGSGEDKITVRASEDWSVESVNLKLVDLPDAQWENTPKTSSTTFYCTPVGDLEKTVYFQIDDLEPDSKIVRTNGIPIPYTIKMQSHGVHTLRIWCTGKIGNIDKSTDVYKYILMFKESGNTTPIIRIKAPKTVEQYSSADIYYNILDPLNDMIDEATIYDGDGVVLSSVVNITSAEQTYPFKPTVAKNTTLTIQYKNKTESVDIEVTKFPYEISAVTNGLMLDFVPTGRSNSDVDYNVFKNNAYDIEVDDDTGEEIQKEIPMTWSFSDNFDWVNGGWQRDGDGDAYFCVKAGTYVDFNYNLFENADTVAKKDAYGNYSLPGIGKEFKIIFKTTNVARTDAEWLSCYSATSDGYNAGIRMEVHNGYISSNIGTLEIPYSEEDIIEFDANIVPISEFSATYEPQFTSKNIPMVLTYEDGTPVQPMVITSASTSFQQKNAVPITIGSKYCDVHIYRMKVYDRYLTDKEILNNFIADARSGATMAERYVRNDIYTADGQLDPATLAEKCPDLFVYVLSAPKFTNDKKDKVENTTIRQYKYDAKTRSWPKEYNWTATGAIHNGQGTSSNEYGYASRNLEFNMKKATITLGDNLTVVKKIQMSETSVPTNYLNLKVNVASSEHCNNALLQKRYDRYLPYTTLASEKDDKVKNSMEFFNCVVFIQETGDDEHREFSDKSVHFYAIGNIGDSKKTDSSRTNDPDDVNEFCVEVMDWNRDLSTFPAETRLFAAHTISYAKAKSEDLTIENLDNLYIQDGDSYVLTSDSDIDPDTTYYVKTETIKYIDLLKPENCGENGIVYEKNANGEFVHCMDTIMDFTKDYYVDVLEGDDFSEDYTYGFRYIQSEWDEDDGADYKEKNEAFQRPLRQKWVEFYRFITRDLTTNGKEDKAKVDAWKKELEDWFILDSALYYYLYTLRYTMVDNRAKNSFYHYGKCPDGKYRYEFWAYDMDTALGIDNAGKLDIPFGQEDHDVDDAGAAHFRAHNSTFFNRIATYFADELNARWAAIEQNTIGNAFDSTSLLNEFDKWQEQFAEELWRLDYERKYKRTYVCGHGDDWDNALPKKNAVGANVTEPRFLKEMMNGRKKYQRRQFERAQDVYMSSKFLGSKNVSDTITLRGAGSSETHTIPANYNLSIIPFANMYINIHDGTTNFYHERCYAGQEYNIDLLGASGAFDFGYIRGSSNIQELGDLSLKYLQTATLNSGSRLKTIKLGNEDARYENKSLKTLAIGSSNRLLEELDIRNLKYLENESLDLPVTNIPSLKRVYAQGSNIRQARFANNGLLEEAYLPATVTELSLRNLHFVNTVEIEGENYDNLVNLTVENCPTMNDKALVMIEKAKNLKSVRVTNVNWVQETSTLLNRIVNMEEGSLLTGSVKILGRVRQRELDAWSKAWPDLVVTYSGIIDQHPVTFLNADGSAILDKNGRAYVQWVDQGEKPSDPITVGDIEIPTIASTAQYDFTFANWAGIDVKVIAPATVTAEYNSTVRTYTVHWLKKDGIILQTKTNVPYGSSVEYDGEWPTMTDNEASYIYNIFTGWDKNTGFITGNTDVYARWQTTNGLPSSDTEMWDMTPVQLYAVATSGNAAKEFVDKDYIDIRMGNDYSYDNVEDHFIGDDVVLNGSESRVVDSNIKLFGEDCGSFTMAIDYEFSAHSNDATLASCYEFDTRAGFRLKSNGTHPVIEFGDITKIIGYSNNRDMLVLRYVKDTNTMHVYTDNGSSTTDSYADSISHTTIVPTKQVKTEATVMLGAFKFLHNNVLDNLGNGTIHWAKVWKEDLGDSVARSLAAWTHEILRFEYTKNNKYRLSSDSSRYTGASFVCKNLLGRKYRMKDSGGNVGGWPMSDMKRFCNDRFYNAFPTVWKSMIRQVQIKTTDGTDKEVISNDYIYLPCRADLDGIASPPYSSEGTQIGWMTDKNSRIKTMNGVAYRYFTRSAYYTYTSVSLNGRYFITVESDGAIQTAFSSPSTNLGIFPCFSI